MTERASRLWPSRADLAGLIAATMGHAAARTVRAANRFEPRPSSGGHAYPWHPATRFDRDARPGGDTRGSAEDRRRRKRYLLATFGDGTTAPCAFCKAPLTFETVTTDRYPIPGRLGGRYVKGNVRPACARCNTEDNGRAGMLAVNEGERP